MSNPLPEQAKDSVESALLLSQLQHANTLLKAQLRRMATECAHQDEIMTQHLCQLEQRISDHEVRLRAATEGVTQFKIFSGLASGSSGIMSLVALIRVFLNS